MLFFLALLVLVQGLGALLVIRANSQIARQTIDQALEQGERVFQRLFAQNQARLEQGAAILSADFAFRQAIATDDTATILSVLRNHGARVGASAMTLVSLDQVVRASTVDDGRVGRPFPFPELVAAARTAGTASSTIAQDERLFQLVLVPVLAPDPIAWIALAFEVDDRLARDFDQLTGLEVSFMSRGAQGAWRLHASTLDPPLREALRSAFATPQGPPAVSELELAGEEYETRVSDLRGGPESRVVAVLQRPLAEGLLPFRRISQTFFWLTLAGLVLLFAGSLGIARSITRPVQRLALAARGVQQGDYGQRVKIERGDEIGELAESFNHMLEGITSREREILRLAYEDGLTTLPNRAMFNRQLEQAVRTARRAAQPLSVLLFDMDRFKTINDTLGHPTGDEVLSGIACAACCGIRTSWRAWEGTSSRCCSRPEAPKPRPPSSPPRS